MKSEIIPKQRVKALKYYSPLLLLIVIILIFTSITSSENAATYLNTTKKQISYLSLSIFTYGLPFCLFIVSLYAAVKGFNVYKYKFNPPKNIPVFMSTETKLSKCPVCIYGLSIAFVLFSLYLIYYGHGVYNEIYNTKNS